jgi:hypothetical protein
MSDLKPASTKIKLGNNEYGMRFTLNTIDDIQEKYDIPISELDKLFKDEKRQIRNLRYLITLLINEDIDCTADETGEKKPHVNERFVGRHITAQNINELTASIYQCFIDGAPKGDDDAPNSQSE